jgi:hypothetical protein
LRCRNEALQYAVKVDRMTGGDEKHAGSRRPDPGRHLSKRH